MDKDEAVSVIESERRRLSGGVEGDSPRAAFDLAIASLRSESIPNGLERMKAPLGQVANFVEWLAVQVCTGNGSGMLCRVNTQDLAWCCPVCRAHILRYGE